MSYKLIEVKVKNFKLFDQDEFTVNLDSELIVFDGPNGYGKTSIFDAIELVLTGNIRRLVSVDSRQVPTDIVVAYNNSKDVTASCKLRNETTGEIIIVSRVLKEIPPAQASKISNFMQLWNTFITVSEVTKEISQINLEKYLNAPNLFHNYSLFHYVEQEDTFHFLKSKNETERAKALSHLLGDTSKLDREFVKLTKFESRLKRIKKSYADRLAKLKPEDSATEAKKASINEIKYRHLIHWNNTSYAWDRSNLSSITESEKKQFLTAVYAIGKLVRHREVFLQNRLYEKISEEGPILLSYLQHYNHLSNYKKIKESVNLSKQLNHSLMIIATGDLNKIKFEFTQDHILNLLSLDSNGQMFKHLDTLILLSNKNSSLDDLYGEIVKYRKQLVIVAKKVNPTDKNCLLCGSLFESNDDLLSAFLDKEKLLTSLLTIEGSETQKLRDIFTNDYLTPLSEFINSKLPTTIYSPDFIHSIDNAFHLKSRLDTLNQWLKDNSVVVTDLITAENDLSISQTHENSSKFKEMILAKRVPLNSAYIEANELYSFESTYLSIFSNSKSNLLSMDINHVNNKRIFIENSYQVSQNARQLEIQVLMGIIPIFDKKLETIKEVKNLYTTEIGKYRKKLIKDVEIPFYIYSGKILQSHQLGQGAGIFIKDKNGGEVLKNIKLVSDWNSDHDVLNMMSSGQISAIVIALLLSLNKIYLNGVKTLLIDDPVQSMDEINMISLLELLRNDFNDLQLIISTHEPDVAKYFLYKYLKFNKSVAQINLMKRTECLLPYSRNEHLVTSIT
ncbi:AAA family ATPase [Psychromonas sp. Urea-02u-13]|uniref:AAA family ATPase n=1 Tax=Psychromonas sp. Urea-02u-13 TaxID=2058326 RepID=UPI000C34769A|nr:AAA family ATPase [Psychromonas sp. Urea-02u-13]PKG37074.1 hypothetical protein CXF74_20810 [Psychromonas sp. Urea-02u-13]